MVNKEIFLHSRWIESAEVKNRDDVVLYKKNFNINKKPIKAELYITACGIYVAWINGKRISFPLTPGFDSYMHRIPYQKYDVTNVIRYENEIKVSVGRGWFGWYRDEETAYISKRRRVKAVLCLTFFDGTKSCIETDESWSLCENKCISSDIYNGEEYDARKEEVFYANAQVATNELDGRLFEFEGKKIKEHEKIKPVKTVITPAGEFVLDFGQNLTGYIEFSVKAKEGEKLRLSYAETLDAQGNFYNKNYRSAKAQIIYVCKDGCQTYKPLHTFCGFRYVRLEEKPESVDENNFVAISVYSDIKRVGKINSSNPTLNKFINNVIWSQKDNFIDVPIDCPQRDERMGWTGDVQLYCRTAMYNFDCKKFYTRWLNMVKCEQDYYGYVPNVVPDVYGYGQAGFSSAWSDVATVLPWTLYQMYGSKELLKKHYRQMKKHVDVITKTTEKKYLWIGQEHFGDWLNFNDISSDGRRSRKEFISSAYYAYSTKLLILAGETIGRNVSKYKCLYENIVKTFQETFLDYGTQTECVLALVFDLAKDKETVARKLVDLITLNGGNIRTGFIGTPYILHALSLSEQVDFAYDLLLSTKSPSWLYSVGKGATTVWERWEGIDKNGNFAAASLNSFNHYVFGSVIDWIYMVCAGITPKKAGFKEVLISPKPSQKLDWLDVSFNSNSGEIVVKWEKKNNRFNYYIKTPVKAAVVIEGQEIEVNKGEYRFNGKEFNQYEKKII